MEKITYTTILHQAREKLKLTTNEYCIADIIYHLSNNPKNKVQGWCYASKQTIGTFIGITKTSVLSIIEKLVIKKIVEKDEETKYLKTTEKWFNIVILNKLKIIGKETIPSDKKLYQGGKETIPPSDKKLDRIGKETIPNNNNIIINNNNSNNNSNNIAGKPANEINLLLKEFEEINPVINYGNKTQRQALEELLKKFGFEKLLKTIKYAVSIQGKDYAPTITTPYQLKNKMGDLLVFYKKQTNKKSNNHIIV